MLHLRNRRAQEIAKHLSFLLMYLYFIFIADCLGTRVAETHW